MNGKSADRRTQKTKKALCNALAELLTEKELHKVTVQEITDRADVNRATFYNHYLDVYDLYEKIEENTLVELGLLMLRLEETSSEATFANLINYISEYRTIFKMIFSPNTTGQLKSKMQQLIEGVLRQIQIEKHGTSREDKKLEYMSSYRSQGCLAVISKWVLGNMEEPEEFIIQTITELDQNMENFLETKKEDGKK